jgi:Ca2+-binding RTX toxin-like protein
VNGGGGYDVVYLRGSYTIDFTAGGYGASTFVGVESLQLHSATETTHANGGGTEFDYNLVWNDALLGAGQTMTINGSGLQANETMVFDGSGESNGQFRLFGGAAADTLRGGSGNDTIAGGAGADILDGNGGADTFRYHFVEESRTGAVDSIEGFTHLSDKIDLMRIDANTQIEGDQGFTFIGAAAFSVGSSAGQLRAVQTDAATNTWRVEGDVDGDGNADLVIDVIVENGQPLTGGDFFF